MQNEKVENIREIIDKSNPQSVPRLIKDIAKR